MAEAYIVEAVRTAGGKRGGKLAGWHPADMGGAVLDAVVDRTGIDPAAIEDLRKAVFYLEDEIAKREGVQK